MNMTVHQMAADIVRRGCEARLELKGGDLGQHIGCACEIWEIRHRRFEERNPMSA